ncbi:acyl carrier protein [Treponema endosymbiont of Eucomonympha sp.]|uniref:acyl carrier protein n=1 Tax=Treponema endosymbiont of Eucomonympha sp. TaxID=1580831 RepID=UPI0007517410|nr:acyl carrier protein [Treponema endosymbiont of Eucomonympha sp.]
MERQEILSQVQDIFRDHLEDDSIVLADEKTANDVEGWDSLMHLQLIVAVENHFKIKFTSKEILQWKNVGEMVSSIVKRLENA